MPLILDPQARLDAETGALLIELPKLGGARWRLASWNDGLTCESVDGAACDHQAVYGIDFLRASARRHPEGPIAEFVGAIPPEVLRLAGAAGTYELAALRLMWRPEARDLAASAPQLFWVLCAAIGEGEMTFDDGLECLRARRPELLARCAPGLSASARLVRALTKIEIDAFSLEGRRTIFDALRSEEIVRLLGRITSIRLTTLRRLYWVRLWFDARWALELLSLSDGGVDRFWEAVTLARDTEQLGIALAVPEPRGAVLRAPTVAALGRLHDRWTAQHHRLTAAAHATKGERQRTPLPDTGVVFAPSERFRVLPTIGEVEAEGLAQQHCAATYVDRCLAGRTFLVHVQHPSATAEVRHSGGGLAVIQLRGPRNAPVDEETAQALAAWIADARYEPLPAIGAELRAAHGIHGEATGSGEAEQLDLSHAGRRYRIELLDGRVCVSTRPFADDEVEPSPPGSEAQDDAPPASREQRIGLRVQPGTIRDVTARVVSGLSAIADRVRELRGAAPEREAPSPTAPV
jgi:hypothetical protein